jgi:hypothetical protein
MADSAIYKRAAEWIFMVAPSSGCVDARDFIRLPLQLR